MTTRRKTKISIRLPRDLVDRIDRAVAREDGATRSSVIEGWLRAAAGGAEASLAAEVIRYYETRTRAEKAEDGRLSRALSSAARRVPRG